MNEFSITPFRGPHLLLLLLTATAVLLIFLLLRGKPEARRSRFLIGVCFFNLALFAGYKLSLSMDAAYIRAYYPNGFNLFNELPLHLCNINLFLIPLDGEPFALDVRTVTSLLVEVMLLSVLLFQDRFNGMIACKNTLAGTKNYHIVFGEDSYTVVTAVTTSTFRYELIDALAESQDYTILLMKKRYVQPLDKRTLTGGTVEEFKRFLEEKTGKTFRRVK